MIIHYYIFDPTGNITALVETAVPPEEQPAVASRIMKKHPDVEQVGFVRVYDDAGCSGYQAELRMAGGEFCGNATMSAAALYALKNGNCPESVLVKASGVKSPVEVRLTRKDGEAFDAEVLMPPALGIEERDEEIETETVTVSDTIPVVRMEGIDHAIIDRRSRFYLLRNLPAAAETTVKELCGRLGSDCLGMMFMTDAGENGEWGLLPLVYVPGADTVFWENSCASGSTAAGMYLAAEEGRAVDISFDEPAGKLRVKSDPGSGETWLIGAVKLSAEGRLV